MAKIYMLESAQEPQTRQAQQGTFTTQNIVLRELEGNSKYDQRFAVEYLGGKDLRNDVGKLVATHISSRFYDAGEKGKYSSYNCREVHVIDTYNGF